MKNTSNKIIKFGSYSKFENENLYRLSELKPAGTKLILDSNVQLIELLKLTLFDLVLKQVLIIKKALRKSHPKDPHLREYIVVETGKNFAKYNSNNFEKYFITRIDDDSYFQLRVFLIEIFKEISSEYKYKNEIIRDLKIKDLFRRGLFSIIFSWIVTNSKGKKLKRNIKDYLSEVDENIGNLINDEPSKALELVKFLQGNIFLLNNLKFEFLEKLKLVSIEQSNNNDENYYDWWLEVDFIFNNDLISDITEICDSVNDYFSSDSGGDWDGDFDFNFD